MHASRMMWVVLIVASVASAWIPVGQGELGVAVPREQASRVFGGAEAVSENHYYIGVSSDEFCSGSKYSSCDVKGNQCTTTTTADSMASNGTKNYINNQPCSQSACEGGVAAICGNMSITGCTGSGS